MAGTPREHVKDKDSGTAAPPGHDKNGETAGPRQRLSRAAQADAAPASGRTSSSRPNRRRRRSRLRSKSNSPANVVNFTHRRESMSSSPTSAALLPAVAQGNVSAFEELYDRHSSTVYGLLLRILANADDAQEVLQETFVKAWTSAKMFDAVRGSEVAWLISIARSRGIDRLRSRRTRVGARRRSRTRDLHLHGLRRERHRRRRRHPGRRATGRTRRPGRAPRSATHRPRAGLLRRTLPIRDRRPPQPAPRHDQNAHAAGDEEDEGAAGAYA